VTRWQAFIVSTGERTIATTMAEGGHRSRPGNRFACSIFQRRGSMAVSTCCTINASGAALSDAIKRAAVTHYGRAGRAFLERLTHDQRDFRGAAGDPQGLARLQPPRLRRAGQARGGPASRCSRWPANWRPNTG
jgi:putative DNA primase/helicase